MTLLVCSGVLVRSFANTRSATSVLCAINCCWFGWLRMRNRRSITTSSSL